MALEDVETKLSDLHRAVDTGFERLAGDIRLLTYADQSFRTQLESLRTDVEALKNRRFPMPILGGAAGIIGAIVAIIGVWKP